MIDELIAGDQSIETMRAIEKGEQLIKDETIKESIEREKGPQTSIFFAL